MPQAGGAERHRQCQRRGQAAPKGTDRAKGADRQRRETQTVPKDINRT